MSTTPALTLLGQARVARPDRPEGSVVLHRAAGDVIVTWQRAAKKPYYDLGVEARVVVTGKRGVVLPLLAQVLAAPGDQSVSEILAKRAA